MINPSNLSKFLFISAVIVTGSLSLWTASVSFKSPSKEPNPVNHKVVNRSARTEMGSTNMSQSAFLSQRTPQNPPSPAPQYAEAPPPGSPVNPHIKSTPQKASQQINSQPKSQRSTALLGNAHSAQASSIGSPRYNNGIIPNPANSIDPQANPPAPQANTPVAAFELSPGVVEPAAFYADATGETPAQTEAANAIADNLMNNIEEAASTESEEALAATWDAEKETADSVYRNIFGVAQYLQKSTEAAAAAVGSTQ